MNKPSEKKKEFIVEVPIAGKVSFRVEASDAEEAIEAAWVLIGEGQEGELEWEYFQQLTSGWVLHPALNKCEAYET